MWEVQIMNMILTFPEWISSHSSSKLPVWAKPTVELEQLAVSPKKRLSWHGTINGGDEIVLVQ